MSPKRLCSLAILVLLAAVGISHAEVQEKWSHVYAGPGDNDEEPAGVALDANGYCYMVGGSDGTTPGDFLVAKYSPTGDVEWAMPINGPGDSADYPFAMLLDANGDIICGGATSIKGGGPVPLLLVKVTSAGTVQWAKDHFVGSSGILRHLIFDPSGNIIAAGRSNNLGYHAYAMKYSPSGDSLWARFYKWSGTTLGNAQRVACASDGSVYITGMTRTANFDDILTVKFSADGDTLWGRIWDGPAHYYDESVDLAVDGSGSVYVAGKVGNLIGGPDIVVLKYDANGNLLWNWIYNGPANSVDQPCGIRIDPDGNLCVGGSTRQAVGSDNFTFIKLSPDGDSLLLAHAGTSVPEETYDMALDAAGNVYLVGVRRDLVGTMHDFLTMKFDGATGAYVWEKTWDGGGGYDRGTHICVGEEDHVYVAGYVDPTGEPDTKSDLGIVAYEPIIAAVFEPSANELPRGFSLHQNSPNPFNAATIIRFDLETGGAATLSIVNILGQIILTHHESDLTPGTYTFEWDGTDSHGHPVASGVYLYQLQGDRQALTRKMVLMK